MWLNVGMPNPKHPCPNCQTPTRAKMCRKCTPPYERTPEHNRAMSIRTTGIPKAGPTGGALPGVAEKIRASWTPERREAARLRGERLARDREWRLRCGRPGELSPTWEDGRTAIPYARGWTRRWKAQAWERAGYRCEICLSDKPRDTHHIDFRKDNHSLDNLQVLCRACHKRLHAEHRREKNRLARPAFPASYRSGQSASGRSSSTSPQG